MNRSEHIAWCKERALDYLKEGDINNAFASMISDLSKHPDTANSLGVKIGHQLFFTNNLSTITEMSNWIEGF